MDFCGDSTRKDGARAAAIPLPEAGADPTSDAYLVRVSRRAMACLFQVVLNAVDQIAACPRAIEALDRIEVLEAMMTVFRDDSSLSMINREAAEGPVDVEPWLFDLLARSIDLWRATSGAFDITAGPLSETWGFARREGRMPQPRELAEAMSRVGSQWLQLDAEAQTIRFARSGVQLNLGAIGKGAALDDASTILSDGGLSDGGIHDFLFHGGQSSVLARGNRAGSEGWTVGLIHPLRPRQRIGEIRLYNRALATSGSGTQFFTHRGRRYGHILDPRSGQPANAMLSATVVAATAAEADAISTALYVMGPQAAAEWCRAHPEVGAILICPGKGAGSVNIDVIQLDGLWQATE